MLEGTDVLENRNSRCAERDGQGCRDLQAHKLPVGPRHFERDGVEEFHGCDKDVNALRRELALFDQVELVIADVVQAELFGVGS